jgi:succinate dehydrogenase hydrophobic anchor subunit
MLSPHKNKLAMQNSSKPLTPLSFAQSRAGDEELNMFIDRIGRVWRYALQQGQPLRTFSRSLELNEVETQWLLDKYSDTSIPSESEQKAPKKEVRAKQKTTIEPTPLPIIEEMIQEESTPSVARNETWKMPTVLDFINYAEMIAAAVGLFLMFSWVGLVFSLITNAFYYDAMRTVKNAHSWNSAQFALFISLILSCVYAFVHYNTAMKTISEDTQFDRVTVSIIAAAILSGISWASMRQSFLKKNEEVENV